MDVNLNAAKCLATQTNWGESIIHNICNGQAHTVPWGTMDYVAVPAIGAFLAAVSLMLFAMGFDILRNVLRGY